MADWYDLPLEILGVIAQFICVIEDFASFSAKREEEIALEHSMVGCLRLAVICKSIYCIHSLNNKFAYPQYYPCPMEKKDILSDSNLKFFLIEFANLGFARLGDTIWTNIQVPRSSYEDVAFCKGKFYAVDYCGALVVCDINDKNEPKAVVVAPPLFTGFDVNQKYLVESLGNLLLVSRTRRNRPLYDQFGYDWYDNGNDMVDDEDGKDYNVDNNCRNVFYYTTGFSIFMLDESPCKHNSHDYTWKEVTSIGDRVLFVGKNVSTSKAASNNIKANCIYFTDEIYEMYEHPIGFGRDTGIFNIEDGTVQLDYAGKSRHEFCPPLWYI